MSNPTENRHELRGPYWSIERTRGLGPQWKRPHLGINMRTAISPPSPTDTPFLGIIVAGFRIRRYGQECAR